MRSNSKRYRPKCFLFLENYSFFNHMTIPLFQKMRALVFKQRNEGLTLQQRMEFYDCRKNLYRRWVVRRFCLMLQRTSGNKQSIVWQSPTSFRAYRRPTLISWWYRFFHFTTRIITECSKPISSYRHWYTWSIFRSHRKRYHVLFSSLTETHFLDRKTWHCFKNYR